MRAQFALEPSGFKRNQRHVPDTHVAKPTEHRRSRVGDGSFLLCTEYAAGLKTGLRRVMQWHARRRSRHPLSEVRRRRATYRAPGAWRWRRSRTLADFREEKSINTIALTHCTYSCTAMTVCCPSPWLGASSVLAETLVRVKRWGCQAVGPQIACREVLLAMSRSGDGALVCSDWWPLR